jgi:hypothetical protein
LPDLVQVWQLWDQGKFKRGHVGTPSGVVIVTSDINILKILDWAWQANARMPIAMLDMSDAGISPIH